MGKLFALCPSIVGGLLAVVTLVASAGDVKDDAMQKDRKAIVGVWKVVQLHTNGNPGNEEDIKKISVVNGADGTWALIFDGREISKGTSTFDPSKKPKTLDFTPTEGEGKDKVFLGIYELGENTRKMCFSPAGKDRPTDFTSVEGTENILVVFERDKSK